MMSVNTKACVFGMLVLMGCIFTRPSFCADPPSPSDAQFQPSGEEVPFDPGQYRDFDDYVRQTRARLLRHKVYMNPNQMQLELAASMPFERVPAGSCGSRTHPLRGIVLLHGLADMPLAMTDLAEAFAARCFRVRVLLLPGHGTRAGDLLNVTRSDWLAATRFGLDTLKTEVDEVYVGGFSLGGLLATHALLTDASLKGAFLFSPALALENAWTIHQSAWLRHLFKWVDRDKQDDYARYEAMPMNAMAETSLLIRELARLLEQDYVIPPVFMAHSADDPVIDVTANRDYFRKRFAHPASRLVEYRRHAREKIDPDDSRIRYVNSFLPEQRIVSFSHLSIHIAPTHRHYGVTGDYRNCGQSSGDRSPDAIARCLQALHPWRGETFGNVPKAIPDPEIMARLTFNPRFEELFEQIDMFIMANSILKVDRLKK